MHDKFKLNEKQDIDNLINLLREGDWKAQDFLNSASRRYCWKAYRGKFYGVPEDEVESIICLSVGKAIQKYAICGKYWGLLAVIFVHDIYDYIRRFIIKEGDKEGSIKIDQAANNSKKNIEDVIVFYKALALKSKEHQKCIQLILEGYNDEEIRNIMGTKKSIKDLKHHARMNLKQVLIKDFDWKANKKKKKE